MNKTTMSTHGVEERGESAETSASENKGHSFCFGQEEGLWGMRPECWTGRVECQILPRKGPIFLRPVTLSPALSV